MTKPQRIQLKRTKGWKMPPNTVKVDRSTRWGNPWRIGANMSDDDAPGGDINGNGEVQPKGWRTCRTAADCVQAFRNSVDWDPDAPWGIGNLVCQGGFGPEHKNRKTIRAELRGKNLACWCKLGEPCHADVLLEIANADEAPSTEKGRG